MNGTDGVIILTCITIGLNLLIVMGIGRKLPRKIKFAISGISVLLLILMLILMLIDVYLGIGNLVALLLIWDVLMVLAFWF